MFDYKRIIANLILFSSLIFLNKLSCFAMDDYSMGETSTTNESRSYEKNPENIYNLSRVDSRAQEILEQYSEIDVDFSEPIKNFIDTLYSNINKGTIKLFNNNGRKIDPKLVGKDDNGIFIVSKKSKKIYINIEQLIPFIMFAANTDCTIDDEGNATRRKCYSKINNI